MDNKKSFFILYPRIAEAEVKEIVEEINHRLCIDYKLWSYAEVEDEANYYQEVVEPYVQDADFVLAFIDKQSEDDFLLNEAIRLCNNLNKSLVPIKIGSGRIKEKNWGFRTKVVDFYDENQRISLIEQMHGWLGLTKIGDVYGSDVLIITDAPDCVIYRNNEVMGKTNIKGQFNCVLAKGSRDILVQTKWGWNKYKYSIPDNNGKLVYVASLTGLQELQKSFVSDWLFDPSSDKIPDWDLTHRADFQLIASSEDNKKREAIYNSYNNYYRLHLVPYPVFHPKEIVHSKGLLIAVWIISIALLFFAFGTGLFVLASFFIIRRQRDNAIIRQNERCHRALIENTDSKNYALWNETNRMMNKVLATYQFPDAKLPNLGTPRDYLQALVVE